MKKRKQINAVLLAHSGELDAARWGRLAEVLSRDESLRALQRDLEEWRSAIHLEEGDPLPDAVEAIHRRLGLSRRRTGPVLDFASARKPALALAAGLMLAAGLWSFTGRQPSSGWVGAGLAAGSVDLWADPLDEDLSRLEARVLALSRDALNVVEL